MLNLLQSISYLCFEHEQTQVHQAAVSVLNVFTYVDLCYSLKVVATTFVVTHKPEVKEAAYKIEEKKKQNTIH